MLSIKNLRENYSKGQLLEKDIPTHPVDLFDAWFQLSLSSAVKEPNAMVLSTVNAKNQPRSRVVLLKDYSKDGFVFYTNYESDKGVEIENNPNVCLNFLWLEMEKQVRIEGVATKVSEHESTEYFNSRPDGSKIGAIISNQSKPIMSREELNKRLSDFDITSPIVKPKHWGGYIIKPNVIEFWQGRANRLHDRIEYILVNDQWGFHRLQP
jgi:pyridoxamine 5'-phosphate oxidase